LTLRVSRVAEEVLTLGRGEAVQEAADPVPQALDGALLVLSKMRLEFGEGFFDWVQVRRVGRQVAQLGARGFDGAANVFAFVRAKIVHHDDVSGLEGRDEDLIDISLETPGVHRAVKDHRRGEAACSKPGREGGDFPMAMRRGAPQALAARRPASEPYHIGGTACFIDEDELLRIEAGLAFAPAPALCSHVRALLLAGQYRFFYS